MSIVIAVIFGLPIGGYLFFKFGVDEPYQRFKVEEAKAAPLFDALNNEVYTQIPIPPGVEKTGDNRNGTVKPIYMWIDYRMVNTTLEQITEFYVEYFVSNGWEYYGNLDYYRGTSCVEINFYYKGPYKEKYSSDYNMVIQHDYFKQTFSPKLPPLWIIQLNEFGERNFFHCPPTPNPQP